MTFVADQNVCLFKHNMWMQCFQVIKCTFTCMHVADFFVKDTIYIPAWETIHDFVQL